MKRTGALLVDEILLEGHLGISKELLRYMSPEKKYYYGSDESSSVKLVKVRSSKIGVIFFFLFFTSAFLQTTFPFNVFSFFASGIGIDRRFHLPRFQIDAAFGKD